MAVESVHLLNMPIGEVDGRRISYGPPTQSALDELSAYTFPLSPDSPEYFSLGQVQRERIDGPITLGPDHGMESVQIRKYLLGPHALVGAGVYVDQRLRGFTGLGYSEKIGSHQILNPTADTIYETGYCRPGVTDSIASTNAWLTLRILGHEGLVAPVVLQERVAAAQKCGNLALGTLRFRVSTADGTVEDSRTIVGLLSPDLSTAEMRSLYAELLDSRIQSFSATSVARESLNSMAIDEARERTVAILKERDRFFGRQLSSMEESTRHFIERGLASVILTGPRAGV